MTQIWHVMVSNSSPVSFMRVSSSKGHHVPLTHAGLITKETLCQYFLVGL